MTTKEPKENIGNIQLHWSRNGFLNMTLKFRNYKKKKKLGLYKKVNLFQQKKTLQTKR